MPLTVLLNLLLLQHYEVAMISATNEKVYNVLFVVADDLRPSLGCYRNDVSQTLYHTPHIDALSRRAAIFENAYAQQALCGPSRTSLLTSRRPDALSVFDNNHAYWRSNVGNFTTLPQYFKERGYITLSAGKVFHPGRLSNKTDDFPFSWTLPPYHPPSLKFENSPECPEGNSHNHRNIVCPVVLSQLKSHTLPDLEMTDKVITWLKTPSITDQRPFFIAAGFYKPHIPLKFPRKFLVDYPLSNISLASNARIPSKLPNLAWNPWMSIRERDDVAHLNASFPYGPLPSFAQIKLRQAYFAAVSFMDEQFGRIIQVLAERKLMNKTVIVFTSDHGWSLGEHGEWEKYSNFGVATRVPLIVYHPTVTQTVGRVESLVELLDLFPSIAELAGLPAPDRCGKNFRSNVTTCVDGDNFAPLLRRVSGETPRENWNKTAVFTQYPRPSLLPNLNSDQPRYNDIRYMGYSIRTRKFRYTEWIPWRKGRKNWLKIIAKELYAISDDAEENNNIVDDSRYANVIARLSERLRQENP